MRPIVEPPPSTKCPCGGELRLKQVQLANRPLDFAVDEVFICARCGIERTFLSRPDKYAVPHMAQAAAGTMQRPL